MFRHDHLSGEHHFRDSDPCHCPTNQVTSRSSNLSVGENLPFPFSSFFMHSDGVMALAGQAIGFPAGAYFMGWLLSGIIR